MLKRFAPGQTSGRSSTSSPSTVTVNRLAPGRFSCRIGSSNDIRSLRPSAATLTDSAAGPASSMAAGTVTNSVGVPVPHRLIAMTR